MSARHTTDIARWEEETPEGIAWCYQAMCSCGAEMGEHYSERAAKEDAARHLEVAPPEQRCRQPKAHRTRRGQRCALCADQLVLPGMADL